MNPTIAVTVRELVARREVVLVAVAAAVIATAMPLMPGLENYQSDDVRTVSSNTLALALGWGLALLFGATMIGGDLSEGRLGFYFARPVSGFTVWWGRVLAALFLILVCEVVVLLPSFFSGISALASSEDWVWPAVIGYLVMPFLLLLLVHAVSIMVRARTAWLFLDLAGFVVFAIVAWVSLRPLLSMVAELAVWVIAGALIVALLVALSVAGWIGVAVGRIDLGRTHGALSLALWGTLAVCISGIAVYSSWLRNFGPPDFDRVEVLTVAPDGRWIEAFGQSRHRLDVRRRCLVSTTDNLWIPLPGQWGGYPMDVVYSVDGSPALWRGAGAGDEPRSLWWADLGRRDPSARQTNLVVAMDAPLALSAAGDRLAILEDETVSFYELEGEHLLKAIRLPDGFERVTALFSSQEALRLLVRVGQGDEQSLLVVNVVVSTGEIVPTGKIKGLGDKPVLMVDGELEHMIVWTRSEEGLVSERNIYDANTGTFIRKLTTSGFPRFLQDGRLVIMSVDDDGGTSLVVESIEGGDRVVHSISAAGEPRLSGEAVPNGVVVSRLEDPSDRTQGMRIDLFDVDSGEVRSIGRHLRRGFSWLPWQYGSAGAVFWFRDQPAASWLFLDQTGALMRWNPETGGLAHIVGGGG
jgi:hypothetical protein